MLQKLSKVPVLGAVLALLTAGLLVQKPDFGVSASNLNVLTSNTISDPSSSELFRIKAPKGRLLSAGKISSLKPSPKPEPKSNFQAQVASITAYRPIAPAEIEAAIRQYATQYGANAEIMITIAKCESGFRAEALSPSGAYGGMYQFVASTWQSNRRAMGLDANPDLRFNAEEAIKTAAYKMGRDGYNAWPACSQKALSSSII